MLMPFFVTGVAVKGFFIGQIFLEGQKLMCLLKTDIAFAVANMPFEHLIVVLLFFLVLAAIVFVNGYHKTR